MVRNPTTSVDASRAFDSLEQEAFLNLWRTYDRLRQIEDALFGQYDLTPQQYNALRLLRGARPAGLPTLSLASRLVSRAPDITRLLDKLEARGLIERCRQSENRRVVQVHLTAEGVTLLRHLDRSVREGHRREWGPLEQNHLQSLVDLLWSARAPHEDAGSTWASE